jgi:hypothetical protein
LQSAVGPALTALGVALTKLLATMYAYFHGAETKLGRTPTDIDATKRAWLTYGNVAKLVARIRLPQLGAQQTKPAKGERRHEKMRIAPSFLGAYWAPFIFFSPSLQPRARPFSD